jgi:hypothetical protein
MSRHHRPFKSTQVFDWAAEPSDERPTDFGRSTGFERSTSFSTLTGYLPDSHTAARRRRESRFGFYKLVATGVVLLVLCTAAVVQLPQLLSHVLKG